ncbi:NADH-quinone oxidoreductase subunit C [Marivibrio halodurans]|uniref:NADH-quinone oxidoreductase subunit C n=1 Tax=Marivibrio halodurans TaxID=2039722 RepID=A0A8J7RW75_9PROT|nr:NADH-quinone oxidoreductase subunit C [Marivibrio halodurans]MBP5855520.1 NADH-quinone oxidoreductase subunit C [Marivibrio halodurans]
MSATGDKAIDALQDLADYIESKFPNEIDERRIANDELSLVVPASSLVRLCKFLRDDANCLFKQCMDICGVDFPDREKRFEIVYNLLSMKHNLRLRLKVETDDEMPVPSVTGVWPSAGWWERETWDLYGVFFSDHPDLRRILTDYGFEGHPLRKDFPLTGFVEPRYDAEQRRVVYEPVRLTQEFRTFDFLSPWEGMTQDLPGDEKAGEGAGSQQGAPGAAGEGGKS